MKKNNKGFTLIELISVLALIAIIATLSFQIVATRIKKSKQRLRDTLYEEIYQASNKYMLANPSLDKYKTSRLCIAISTLQDKGFLEKGEIKNPVTNESLIGYHVEAQYDSDTKQYQFSMNTTGTCTSETSPLLGDYLVDEKNLVVSTGTGLYEETDSYVYKGDNPNNYVSFNGSLWRIISIDKETKFVKIMKTTSVADGYLENGIIESLNASYNTSDSGYENVKNYISSNSKWYTGTVDNLANVSIIRSLERQKTDYYTVGLLSISDYLSSFVGTNSYLKGANMYFLSDKSSTNQVWYYNGTTLAKTAPSTSLTYKVYPVIYLNLNARINQNYTGRIGSLDLPYELAIN